MRAHSLAQVSTPIDPSRRASIAADGMNDPSEIRAGQWGEAWEGLLRWSVLSVVSFCRDEYSKMTGLVSAWEDFLRFPVR